MMIERKRLPVGVENFEQIINDNYYYVDKTGLISELLRSGGMVNLFTRPRRFGKTLNMSMPGGKKKPDRYAAPQRYFLLPDPFPSSQHKADRITDQKRGHKSNQS